MKASEFNKLSKEEKLKVPFKDKPTINKVAVGCAIPTIVFFILVVILGTCNDMGTNNGDKIASVDTTSVDTSTVEETKWLYSDEKDKMSEGNIHLAQINANDELQFEFPYNGGSVPSILLRNKDGVSDAMFQISKGQFLPNIMDDKTIRVRFDNGKAERYSYLDPADGSTTTIFIKNSKKFISKIRKARKTVIECEFYSEGSRVMEFDTDGLKFD